MIVTAPWLKQVRPLAAMANGAFVVAVVTLQVLIVTVAAAYAPHSLLKWPELA